MARFLLQVALPLFAPLAIYIGWLWYAQKRAEKYGNEPPSFARGTAYIALVAGAVLAILSLVALALTTGQYGYDDGAYSSPRLEDGKIVGPSFDDEAPENTGEQYRSE